MLLDPLAVRGLSVDRVAHERYIPLALLIVLLAALLIKAVRVWHEIHDVEEPDTPSDLLASFEQAHAARRAQRRRNRPGARATSRTPSAAGAANIPTPREATDQTGSFLRMATR